MQTPKTTTFSKRGAKLIAPTLLALTTLTLLAGCSADETTTIDKVTVTLEDTYDTTFTPSLEYTPKDNTQKGILISQEGVYVDYEYDIKTDKVISDTYLSDKENHDLTSKLASPINEVLPNEENSVLFSVYKTNPTDKSANTNLEGVIFLDEGIELTEQQLETIVQNSPYPNNLNLNAYYMSHNAFKSLRETYKETGNLTKQTAKQYLYTNHTFYQTY